MIKFSGNIFHGVLVSGCFCLAYINRRKFSSTQQPQQKIPHKIEDALLIYGQQFKKSQIMEKMIPRSFLTERDLQKLTDNLYYRRQSSHLSSLTKSLSQPIWDLLDRGGKKWRPVLCMLIAELYGRKRDEVYDIAALCEIIHNGTLICDDIEDGSTVRRNKPCVHLIYGMDVSLNAGNFMYYAPLLYLIKSGKYSNADIANLAQIYTEQMVNLHIGQGWDILWHNIQKLGGNYPTEEDYLQMTAHKTGVLARLSARLVCLYLRVGQEESKILVRLAETMGVAFQIQDDLLNLQGQQFKKTKGYNGQDIHQGKISLMVIHCLQNGSQNGKNRLVQILKQKTQKMEDIQEAIAILRQSGSLAYARSKMRQLVGESWRSAEEKLPNNPARNLLKQLCEFGIIRTK